MFRTNRLAHLASLFVLVSVQIAGAQSKDSPPSGPGWGYVFVDPRPVFGFVPNLGMSFNSNGGAITAIRTANSYAVFLGGITEQTAGGFVGGIAHVSAYGEGYCNIVNWHPVTELDPRGPGTELTVSCFDDSGLPATAGFVLTFSNSRRPGTGTLAWLFGDRLGPANPDWSYNSTGLSNTISQLGRGVYTVDLPGTVLTHGTAQVTAYGPDNGYCNLGSWGLRIPSTHLEVRCFDHTGALSDHAFTLSFAENVSLLGDGPTRVTYSFVSDGFSLVPRFGERAHQFNSAGYTDVLQRVGSPRRLPNWLGNYGLSIRGLLPVFTPSAHPIPIAVAFGTNAHCRPRWTPKTGH